MQQSDKRYTITELIRAGVVSPSVKNDIEVKDKIRQLKSSGFTHGAAVRHVAKELGFSVQSVYKSLKRNKL